MKKKYFIITIDTEGDDLWTPVIRTTGMRKITTKNAGYIERFQQLCDKYGLIPTYLVNHEMINAKEFVDNAVQWQNAGRCEIGMHMHAWNCPPFYELKYKRNINNPYAGDYPRKIMWRKLQYLTREIEDKVGRKPTSHRGGRWYIDSWYINALQKLGYEVDCSVTPGVSWKDQIGYEKYGCDYRFYSKKPYRMDKNKIWKSGKSNIIQVQPTIKGVFWDEVKENIEQNGIGSTFSKKNWLRPDGKNLKQMLRIAECKDEYIEFMLHSSELMPGGSPNFRTEKSIECLYKDIDILFDEVSKTRAGISLTEYSHLLRSRL